jgi:hypothetical protein
MINIGDWSYCKEELVPMSAVVMTDELDKQELDAIEILLQDIELVKYQHEELSMKGGVLPFTDPTSWLYGRILKLFMHVNQAYDVPALYMIENITYIEYESGDFHALHADLDTGVPFSSRKLSMCINLSASEDYRGGEMEFLNGPDTYVVSRSVGTSIVYPSYLMHKTNKITSGKRRILLAWVSSIPNQLKTE